MNQDGEDGSDVAAGIMGCRDGYYCTQNVYIDPDSCSLDLCRKHIHYSMYMYHMSRHDADRVVTFSTAMVMDMYM